MSVAISVDASRVRFMLDQLKDSVSNVEQGLLEAVDNTVIPDLYANSTTVWNVRTGLYSSSWYSQIAGMGAVKVGNDAGYSAPLEWGWNVRGGAYFITSPGVLYPTVYSNLELIAGELIAWIQRQIAV